MDGTKMTAVVADCGSVAVDDDDDDEDGEDDKEWGEGLMWGTKTSTTPPRKWCRIQFLPFPTRENREKKN